ncbi:unannotated protein [freshwater metagenome]|uniref:Unannotated protein n=1 Tax=freshwater metagenome TaxID=449393 RepID=A0A6J6NFH7_9ZZZZ
MTMQNVACPITTVSKPVLIPAPLVNALLRAIPVTTPGNEIGSTTSKEMVSRPKNWYLLTAKASAVPSKSAITVADTPARMLQRIASRTPVFSSALAHHFVVNSLGGQLKVLLLLKELITTTVSGI